MKIKHILVVSLILAILTIGAVSASEVADDIAADNVADDSILELGDDPDDYDPGEELDEDWDYDEDYDDVDIDISDEIDVSYDDIVSIEDYDGVNGTITLSIDGVQYFNKQVNYFDNYYIWADDLNLPDTLKTGKHYVEVTYLKNGVDKYTENKTSTFTYSPELSYPDIAVGQTAYVGIKYLSGSSGVANLYSYTYDSNDRKISTLIATVNIVNGYGLIAIPNLSKGNHNFDLNMTINGQKFDRDVYIYVAENTAGFSATVEPTVTEVGNTVIVKITGPSTYKDTFGIYVDGLWVSNVNITNTGSVSYPVLLSTAGQHIIQVSTNYDSEESDSFYSNVLYVTANAKVNPTPAKDTIKLTLSKVKVKKSAKKLVIKATLKINGKKVKGKKITFKFNGKKLTAKTNKKGVAKATVKAKILKKLKVGKKVTYQASYGGKTAKKTVKVSK